MHDKTEYRIHAGVVQKRAVGERRWQSVALGTLAKEYPVGQGPWPWLREQGVTRPSPSGYTSEAEAKRPTIAVKLRLTKPDAERLDELAESHATTKSALVSGWIRRAKTGRRDGGTL